ncbi:MAG TPA: hypothetical protein VKP58_00560 [Candidatus Acidoferrum sp.]|nr:hypothetical protein [Candidatus Acidoferrum sp.]
MSALHSLLAVARSDFRERTRRYSFLLTLLFAVFLGYATATGKVLLQLEEYRGIYTSGWIGTLVALVITCFVSLVGFYIVKNAVERDRMTGVGQILAASTLSKPAYTFGKFLSNFAVLSSMVGVLAVAALIMQFVAAEDPNVNYWALLSPFLLLALPTMALTAVIAPCFETIPLLRGGFGNVAWFFVWVFGLSTPFFSGKHWLDPLGLITVVDSLSAEAKKAIPGYHGGLAFQIQIGQKISVAENLRWAGISWDVPSVLLRVAWLAFACALALFASLIFDRFDSYKSAVAPHSPSTVAVAQLGSASPVNFPLAKPVHLTPLVASDRAASFFRQLRAELRLALQGFGWWWYAVAAAFVIAEAAAPLSASYGIILGFAWIWPVLIWSAMGSRESRFAMRPVLFSSSRIVPFQILVCWSAGFIVALLTGAGTLARLVIAGRAQGLLAFLAGAVFIPSLALALGVVSESSKFFEGLYALLWYIGPMNHTPGLDYTGAADGAHGLSFAVKYFAIAAACLGAACAFRARQLRGN